MGTLKPLAVVKMGGSLITDKACMDTLKPAELAQAVEFVRELRGKYDQLIIIHGAGSFAHLRAQKLINNWPLLSESERSEAIKAIQAGVKKLNTHVSEALQAVGIETETYLPRDFGSVDDLGQRLLQTAFSGLVPLTGGDIALDTNEIVITSGDTTLESLGGLSVERMDVFFLTGTGGVLGTDGQILPEVAGNAALHETDHDVTGGMIKKLSVASSLVKNGHQVWITSPEAWERGLGTRMICGS